MKKLKPLLIILLILFSCSQEEKTDQILFEKDQQKLLEHLDNFKVSIYKFIKVSIRAGALKDSISPELIAFQNQTKKLNLLLSKSESKQLSFKDYLELYRTYKATKAFIEENDEDNFPTILEAIRENNQDSANKNKPFLQGEEKIIAQNSEHAMLSVFSLISKDLGKEIALYECFKTKPDLLPDGEIKALLQFLRAFVFLDKKLLYLSENELTQNINWLNKNPDADWNYTGLIFGWGISDKQKIHSSFHALNHLLRAFDRLQMERKKDEEKALQDLEIFLDDSRKIGANNEITWAIEAYLYIKKENPEKAIIALTKLKNSPLLSQNEQNAIKESIKYLENRESGKTLNGIYDKFFLTKIASRYILNQLAEVDWKSILEENNVPYTKEIFENIEQLNELISKLNEYAKAEKLKEKGSKLWNAGKDLLE